MRVRNDDIGISVSEKSYLHMQSCAIEYKLLKVCERYGFTLDYYYKHPKELPLPFYRDVEAQHLIAEHIPILEKLFNIKHDSPKNVLWMRDYRLS